MPTLIEMDISNSVQSSNQTGKSKPDQTWTIHRSPYKRHQYSSVWDRSQRPSTEIFESLCRAFQTKKCSLNSPVFALNQHEFTKMLSTVDCYRSNLEKTVSSQWHIEYGEHSTSFLDPMDASKERLVCHLKSKHNRVLGKVVIKDPEDRFIVPKFTTERNSNLHLLKNMEQFSNATVKDRYQVPQNFTTLENIKDTNHKQKQNFFGVVTAVNKVPTKSRTYWHSFLCISDPSLTSSIDGESETPPEEFKMHLFFPFQEDHPAIHRGDVIKFTNVKV